MERDANYVAVGAFMLLLLAMAVWFVLWYSGSNDRREYNQYEIYLYRQRERFGSRQFGALSRR